MVYHRPFPHGGYVGMISHAHFDSNVKISVCSVKSGGLVVIPTNLPSVSTLMISICISLMAYSVSS